MRSLVRASTVAAVIGLRSFSLAAAAPEAAPVLPPQAGTLAQPSKGESAKQEDAPPLDIACVRIIDRETLGGFDDVRESGSMNIEGKQPSKQELGRRVTVAECVPGSQAAATLVGTGDVLVVMPVESYQKLVAYQQKVGLRASLFVNGVNLKDDAPLVGIERSKTSAFLRYSIKPGPESKVLWSGLYRAGTTDARHELRVGLGWAGGPTTDATAQIATPSFIAITDPLSFKIAVAVILILLASGLTLGAFTDTFRDAKTPEIFRGARRQIKLINRNDETKVLRDVDPTYLKAKDAAYKTVAQQALRGGDLSVLNPTDAVVGLILLRSQKHSLRASFSLARVQLGLWFLFAVATGAFLWVIYGELPGIDNSLLALLGLSVGVTGVSLAVDQGGKATFIPSRGILTDLVTDPGGQQQVHRFQAVVVNLLLLAVGTFHVFQHLTYPIFDPTWLVFLGISGVAYTAGKQITEK